MDSQPNQLAENSKVAGVILVVAVTLSLFQVWQPLAGFFPPGALPMEAILGLQPATYFRPTHLVWILVLGYLVYPLGGRRGRVSGGKTGGRRSGVGRWLDWLMIGLILWAGWRILQFQYQGIDHLLNGLSLSDFLAGILLVIATLEMARRSVGPVMMFVGLIFIVYGAFGNYLPDVVATRGFSFERIVRFQVFSNAGLFGAPLGIAAGAVFSFVLFGAFLQVTGAGKFMIDLSFAAAGRYRGGPAKASVIASAAMGSISGSAIANTVTTGSLTIPMMKKLGFAPSQAAGIEASASTGGQIMPPIMGAGAFVMAELTKTPYADIVWMSLIPAILYFLSVLLYVHILAAKAGFKGMQDGPKASHILRNGLHFLLPLFLITGLLLQNYSPVLVGISGCAAVVCASLMRRHTRIGISHLVAALRQGAILAIPISVACAIAGLVVGTIGQTGVGLQFTESVVALSNGQLWLALLLVALAALILGMGLPATAAYIVLAVMTGPALQELGLALITAHMIIFWLSQTSNVTPPIALAAFASAGIAGASPMRSAIEAFKLSSGLFVIPLMMAYSPLLLGGQLLIGEFAGVQIGWLQVVYAGFTTLALILMVAMLVERFLFARVGRFTIVVCLVSAALLLTPGYRTQSIGIVLCCAALILNYLQHRSARQTEVTP